MTNVSQFRYSGTIKLSRAEIPLKRCTAQTHAGVTNDKLTFMASGYPCVSGLPIISTLWHSRVNEIIVSSMPASMMFYFTWVHLALHLQGFAFKQEGRTAPF